MSVEIPNGAVATYQGQWSFGISGLWKSPGDVYAAVGQSLVEDGLTIAQSTTPILDQLNFAIGGNLIPTLQIVNQSGQELDDTDLLAQVTDAVTQAGGTVTGAAVTQVTGSASGVNSGTGSLGQVTPAGQVIAASAAASGSSPTVHQCGDPSWSFWQDPAQWITCLTTKGLTTVGLLAIGLVIGIVLIVAAPRVVKPL